MKINQKWGIAASIALAFTLTGCASKFAVIGDNEYSLAKMSSACAAGSGDAVLEDLRQEALKFCAARNERPVELRSSSEYGIPVVRCASAELVFGCSKNNSR